MQFQEFSTFMEICHRSKLNLVPFMIIVFFSLVK